MTTKHTPGPWHVDTEDQDADIHSGFGMAAKTMGHGHAQDGEGTANARLIAAAPELLDALNEQDRFLGVLSGTVPLSEKDTHRRIQINREAVRAAIAKATGSGE